MVRHTIFVYCIYVKYNVLSDSLVYAANLIGETIDNITLTF